MKWLLLMVALGLVLIGGAIWQRHILLIHFSGSGAAPPLLDPAEESPNSRWFDDYFLIEPIDSQTYAIGEPRYLQQNFSYLIIGEERAVLFDAGPGHRDIRGVAESLTELPITFVPSHFHYDHVGNQVTFDQVAVVDLPYLRARATDNQLTLNWQEHLGASEGVEAPTLYVNEWLSPGDIMSLGGRDLRVLYTPGHTEDSISLLDLDSGDLFTGDFIYPGPLYAFLPNSGMGDYLQGAETVLNAASANTVLLGAHRVEAPGLPRLNTSDVADLRNTLVAIKAGEAQSTGIYPVSYPVNDQLELLAEPKWLQDWAPKHPGL